MRKHRTLCVIVALCVMLFTLAMPVTMASTAFTAFSVLVTERDGRTSVEGATVQVGTKTKTTNINGFAAFSNVYFDSGNQTMTVSKNGYATVNFTVGARNEGQTIEVVLPKQ